MDAGESNFILKGELGLFVSTSTTCSTACGENVNASCVYRWMASTFSKPQQLSESNSGV